MEGAPCLNPNCKSYGRPHPNCHCHGLSEFALERFANGGCVGPHSIDCEHYADGGEVEHNVQFAGNPDLAVDRAVANHGLSHLLAKTGTSRSENQHKPLQDFIDHSRSGKQKVHSHVHASFDANKKHEAPDTSALNTQLDALHRNPNDMLNIGGSMGQSLPGHAAAVSSKATVAASYLKSLKPTSQQPGPLDRSLPPSKGAEYAYNKQVEIAEQPLSILHSVKNGTVQPQDLITLNTIYPQLAQEMKDKAFDKIVTAQASGEQLSYRHKIGLSNFLGIPLDNTMTQSAMAAIIQSGAAVAQQRQIPPKAPTAQTQKTIDKSNTLGATSLQSQEIDSKTS